MGINRNFGISRICLETPFLNQPASIENFQSSIVRPVYRHRVAARLLLGSFFMPNSIPENFNRVQYGWGPSWIK